MQHSAREPLQKSDYLEIGFCCLLHVQTLDFTRAALTVGCADMALSIGSFGFFEQLSDPGWCSCLNVGVDVFDRKIEARTDRCVDILRVNGSLQFIDGHTSFKQIKIGHVAARIGAKPCGVIDLSSRIGLHMMIECGFFDRIPE